MTTELQQLRNQLKQLQLHEIEEIFEEEAKKAIKTKMAYTSYLGRLVEQELLVKTDRSVQTKISKAKLPQLKTLEMFDFSFQKSLDERLIKELGNLGFIERKENILFIGPPGVGKTHLAISLGVLTCQSKIRTLFTQASSLADELFSSLIDRTTNELLDSLSRITLMIIDELGYISMDSQRANFFFQLISIRYGHTSTIITTNLPFEEWSKVFANDEVISSAILDRFLHYCHIIPIQGGSYRVKDKLKKSQNKEP